MVNNNKLRIDAEEKALIKSKGKCFYFWYCFDRIEMLLTPNEHISDKFSLKLLARLWFIKMISRNRTRIGIFNEQFYSPYIEYNLFFNKKKARKETLKVYLKTISFLLINIIYLSLIFFYDTLVYEKVMNQWFVEIMGPKYIINK